jgi:hypothetical protein
MWRRRSRRLTLAVALLVVIAGAGSAYAAWSATTSPPSASFSGAPDWTAPVVSSAGIQKGGATTPGWSAGYVKPGGQYYAYSQVAADTGSPASGIATGGVTAGLTALTSGQTAAAFTAGSYSSQGSTFNYRAGPFTVGAGVAAGAQTYTVTAKDNANNSKPLSATVTVDGTAPTGSDVQTVRNGGTAGKAETGDQLVLTFSEPIDPGSIISGWDGTSRSVTFEIVNGSGSAADTVAIFNGATKIAGFGTITLPDKNYVKSTVDFTSSTMVLSGSTLTVTLGTTSGGANVTTGGAGSTKWIPAATFFDRAGNVLTSTTVTESGTSDAEF